VSLQEKNKHQIKEHFNRSFFVRGGVAGRVGSCMETLMSEKDSANEARG